MMIRILSLVLLGMVAAMPSPARAEDAKDGTVVHLSKCTNDLHAALMALELATQLRKSGSEVTLFLDLEGVRCADSRQSLDLRWGGSGPLAGHYDAFVAAGGAVVVCPHCAEAAGVAAGSLRKGARVATFEEVAELMKGADRILDY